MVYGLLITVVYRFEQTYLKKNLTNSEFLPLYIREVNCFLMADNVKHLELIRQAQVGGRESMDRLAVLVKQSLCAYIYRVTLNHDITQDLSQETLLEMVKSLRALRQPDRFWPWLFRIARRNIDRYFKDPHHNMSVQMSTLSKEYLLQHSPEDCDNGLKNVIGKELSQIIFEAIKQLSKRQRHVLVLRCFEQMSYLDIAAVMDCSQLNARVLFFQAKHSFKRKLARRGFGKELLVPSLLLFGQLTAPTKAASATTTVTAASLKVGLFATVISTVGTKVGVAVAAGITAAALAVGHIATVSDHELPNENAVQVENSLYTAQASGNNGIAAKGPFEYPCFLLDAHCPDSDGWRGRDADGLWSVPVIPEQLLVGPPPSDLSLVSVPKDHWLELKSCHDIIDGPGNDIVLVGISGYRKQADVFITDGAGQEHLLGRAVVPDFPRDVRMEIGFDIGGILLPFVPCAVRIVGADDQGTVPSFDLCSVRVRTYIRNDQYLGSNND